MAARKPKVLVGEKNLLRFDDLRWTKTETRFARERGEEKKGAQFSFFFQFPIQLKFLHFLPSAKLWQPGFSFSPSLSRFVFFSQCCFRLLGREERFWWVRDAMCTNGNVFCYFLIMKNDLKVCWDCHVRKEIVQIEGGWRINRGKAIKF